MYEYLNEELDRLSEGKVMVEDASKLSVVAALLHAISQTNERIVLVSYFTQARAHTSTLIQFSFERSLTTIEVGTVNSRLSAELGGVGNIFL